MRKLIILLFILLIISFSTGLYFISIYLDQPLGLDSNTTINVERGSTLTAISRKLHQRGILDHPRVIVLYARLFSKSEIRAGEYLIEMTDSPLSILDKLTKGNVIQYQITIPEGWNFEQILNELNSQENLEHLIDAENYKSSLEKMGFTSDHPEGWFFPDTYNYHKGISDIDILRKAYIKMQQVLEEEWSGREESLPLKTPYEALILASIVEKETAVSDERKKIAGVFIRRLELNMKLQTDPTVIYGLGKNYIGNLKRRHLSEYTPYNTYVIKGLPPTPIAMPGRRAIHAVLHPDKGHFLYFVAKGDGTHYFSVTIEEHRNAVKKFQINNRAKEYRSTPK
jgi:UPF0755 protein